MSEALLHPSNVNVSKTQMSYDRPLLKGFITTFCY